MFILLLALDALGSAVDRLIASAVPEGKGRDFSDLAVS
jgi:hypothetical protein